MTTSLKPDSKPQPWFVLLLESERIRFLAVGSWNTLVGYLCFLLCYWLMGNRMGPFGTLVASYCFAIPHSYLTQRLLVFRSRGPWMTEFFRFLLANSTIFAANLILLPLIVKLTYIDERWVQAMLVVVLTVMSYLAHRHYSFSRSR